MTYVNVMTGSLRVQILNSTEKSIIISSNADAVVWSGTTLFAIHKVIFYLDFFNFIMSFFNLLMQKWELNEPTPDF